MERLIDKLALEYGHFTLYRTYMDPIQNKVTLPWSISL
jgi:hypothetical protein